MSAIEQAESRFGKFLLFERLTQFGILEMFLAGAAPGGHRVQLVKINLDASETERCFPLLRDQLSRAGFLFHASLQRIHEFGIVEETPFCTQEDFEGLDLESLLSECRRQRVPMPLSCALFIAREIASALAYSHERRLKDDHPLEVIHGSVLPKLVTVGPAGDVKLGGFGLMRALDVAGKLTEVLDDSSRALLAPEAQGRQELDPRTDVYGCAAMLYRMLTFRTPVPDRPNGIVPPSKLRRRIDTTLDDLVLANLALEPEERYASADLLEEQLSRLLYREAPWFAPVDLGAFLTALFDGTLARRLEEKRAARRLESEEEPSELEVEVTSVRAVATADFPMPQMPFSPVAAQSLLGDSPDDRSVEPLQAALEAAVAQDRERRGHSGGFQSLGPRVPGAPTSADVPGTFEGHTAPGRAGDTGRFAAIRIEEVRPLPAPDDTVVDPPVLDEADGDAVVVEESVSGQDPEDLADADDSPSSGGRSSQRSVRVRRPQDGDGPSVRITRSVKPAPVRNKPVRRQLDPVPWYEIEPPLDHGEEAVGGSLRGRRRILWTLLLIALAGLCALLIFLFHRAEGRRLGSGRPVPSATRGKGPQSASPAGLSGGASGGFAVGGGQAALNAIRQHPAGDREKAKDPNA